MTGAFHTAHYTVFVLPLDLYQADDGRLPPGRFCCALAIRCRSLPGGYSLEAELGIDPVELVTDCETGWTLAGWGAQRAIQAHITRQTQQHTQERISTMSTLQTFGTRAYSYGTCIKDVLPDGRSIGNVTKYSSTTSGHQNLVGSKDCDVTVSGIPQGTDDLTGWYLARHPETSQRVPGTFCDQKIGGE